MSAIRPVVLTAAVNNSAAAARVLPASSGSSKSIADVDLI
jgi:hypothetical protein